MFITFEGPDGCGKTTQITLLAKYLSEQGHAVCHTREPGGTSIGEQVRGILHSQDNQEMVSQAEILLYSASRAQLVAERIIPALDAGTIVLCDRYYDSTLAYQGYGRGLDLETLGKITRFATQGLKPDLTLYLDIDPEAGLRRRQMDHEAEWNRLDALALDFHRRVHEGYQRLMEAEPGRWVRVDAARPVEVIQSEIRQIVIGKLGR
jgi:dTMP kinase